MKFIIKYLFLAVAITANSLSQINEYKLLPSDGAANDQFGSVSLSGDYAIVGATHNDSTGAAYVFRREGSAWIEEQKLVASDGSRGDWFGFSISISGDYAVIGAPNNDSTGAVYIFKREGSDWFQEQKLQTSDALRIGGSVSISGGYVIIGALDNDSPGSVYVFRQEGNKWIEEKKLQASNDSSRTSFGSAVSISGDYIIIGSPHFIYPGLAYIFRREGTNWLEEQKLIPSGDTLFNRFGYSVSISGEYAVVGSYGSFVNSIFSGAAYVFRQDGTNWVEEEKLFPSDGANNDWFGLSVSISDGFIIVGSHWDDDYGSASGSAYIFRRQETSWIEQQKLTASDADMADIFGVSVAVSGEYVIVGAPGKDDNGENSGSAYIYNRFVVGVENEKTEIPLSFKLEQNYPNPFNPTTIIKYSIPSIGAYRNTPVQLKVYDILGNKIETLVNEEKSVGSYEVEWNARDLPSGVYFYKLQADNFIQTRKMLLIK